MKEASASASVKVEALAERHLPALAALFERAGSTCFCRFWHFTGDKNAWLDRNAHRPEENRRELEQAVRAGDPGARGLVALDGDRVVGWMKLAPLASLPKLRRLPVYRSVGFGDEATTYAIACFLVDPARRRQGVATALTSAAAEHARAFGAGPGGGAAALVAFPRRSDDPRSDEEAWLGTEPMFEAAGFATDEDQPASPYPVHRKRL